MEAGAKSASLSRKMRCLSRRPQRLTLYLAVSRIRMRNKRIFSSLLAAGIFFFLTVTLTAQEKIVWSDQERPIVEQIRGLRKLDDSVRARTTRDLALQSRQLPVVPN